MTNSELTEIRSAIYAAYLKTFRDRRDIEPAALLDALQHAYWLVLEQDEAYQSYAEREAAF